MSELTLESIRRMMDKLPKPELDVFNPFRMPMQFAGRDVFEEPPPPAKIQVRQIFLKDGTPLLPEKFLREENARWAATWGYRDALCKDQVFLLGNYGILMSAQQRHMITNITG